MDELPHFNKAVALVEARFAREAPGLWHLAGLIAGMAIGAAVFVLLTIGVRPRSSYGTNFAQELIGFLVSAGPPVAVALFWERRERAIINSAVEYRVPVRPKTLKSTVIGWVLGFAALGIGQALCAWARLPAFGN